MTEAAEVAAARYRLRFGGRRFRGRVGDRRGSAPGSSLEFLDFRDYAPGDDLRLVDWNGYARSDQLRVRQQAEEVSPFVDIVVDGSASMACTPAKERAVGDLVTAFTTWARREGATPRVLRLGGDATAPALPPEPLRMASVRVLVTDGFWRTTPRPLVCGLAANAAWLLCVQVLDPWEAAPATGDALTLHDCETGERLDVRLDGPRVDAYRERLERLCAELQAVVVSVGGSCVRVLADSLPAMCDGALLPAGVVEPA